MNLLFFLGLEETLALLVVQEQLVMSALRRKPTTNLSNQMRFHLGTSRRRDRMSVCVDMCVEICVWMCADVC